jgi:hypothetical protein
MAREAQAILDGCEHLRDRLLFAVLYDTGIASVRPSACATRTGMGSALSDVRACWTMLSTSSCLQTALASSSKAATMRRLAGELNRKSVR